MRGTKIGANVDLKHTKKNHFSCKLKVVVKLGSGVTDADDCSSDEAISRPVKREIYGREHDEQEITARALFRATHGSFLQFPT